MPRTVSLLTLLVLTVASLPAQSGQWNTGDLVQPKQLADRLKDAKGNKPLLIEVSFPILFRNRRIPGAVFAGPGAKPEGIEQLKKAAAGLAKDREIVLYCGCCPMVQCPNVRPALSALRALGFQRVKVLFIESNLAKDWIDQGYPIARGPVQ